MSLKRAPKLRLIDKSVLAINDTGRRLEPKPDAWLRSDVHLEYIRDMPCCICGRPSIKPDHRTRACHVWKDTDGCKGEKPSDCFVWPGCDYCHTRQHNTGEVTFHAQNGVQWPAMWVVKKFAVNSPCEKTRLAAGRWMESGSVNEGRK